MFVKILGAFDLFVAVILFLLAVKIIHVSTGLMWLFVVLIILLAIKSIPNLATFCIGSIIDVVIVIVLIIAIFAPVNVFILMVAAFAIAQKGVASFL